MESRQPPAPQGIDGFFGRHLVDGVSKAALKAAFGGHSVFQALHGGGDAAAPGHEVSGGEGVDRLDRGRTQQAAELHRIPHGTAGGGNDASGLQKNAAES